ELEALLHVAHPNLITLFDFGQTLHTDQYYLAFEYFPGQDFVTASRSVSLHQFYSMLAQVCMALDALHRRGYVHGDLKPQNMMVLSQSAGHITSPIVKLCDLGYAHGAGLSPWTALRGCASYMAPELVEGERPTSCADLYSFGVVLYECLT